MDADALDVVLGKLEGVRKQGGYWMARCPAHEDRQASLSVARGTEQPVVFKCHAGCERDTILDALGLTLADISKPHEESREIWTPRGPAIAVYDYTDEHGTLLFQVYRTVGKQFPQRRADDGKWRLGDCRRVPYRLPRLLDAIRNGQPVYIAEGEKDVHAIEAAGGAATTSPGGAGKWRDEYDHYFTGADAIIVADKDDPGRYHAADVARHLRPVARSVTITEAAEGKDAADHLATGHTLAELAASKPHPGAFVPVSLAALISGGVPPPELLPGDLLYHGGIHVVSGEPDCGKTTFCLWQVLGLLRTGRPVLMLDEEGGPDMTAEKLIALGATERDVSRLCYVPFPATTWDSLHIAELRDLVTATSPAMILFDSCAAFMARAGLDENAAADVTNWWARLLTPLAREHGTAVVVIDHDVKNGQGSRFSRGSGAKLAASDVMVKLAMTRSFSRTQDGVLRMVITKDRRGWLHRWWDVEVRTQGGLSLILTEGQETGLVPDDMPPGQRKLYAVLSDEPLTQHELVDRMRAEHGNGLQRQTASTYLNNLSANGLADRLDQGPGRTPLWTRTRRPDLSPDNPTPT